MKQALVHFLISSSIILVICSCSQTGPVVKEEDDSGFQRAMSLLKVGNDEDALEEFLSVTRRTVHCPKSHLHVGMLFLNLEPRKDPIASIYHFQRFLLLENNSKEALRVRQLIVTAEREIIRKLPGEPYSDYLDSIQLREENLELKREIADLKARLGMPITAKNDSSINARLPKPKLEAIPKPAVSPRNSTPSQIYEVQKGDSLYGISRKFYGDSSHMDRIFQVNRNSLKSKNSLRPGQKLIIPAVKHSQ